MTAVKNNHYRIVGVEGYTGAGLPVFTTDMAPTDKKILETNLAKDVVAAPIARREVPSVHKDFLDPVDEAAGVMDYIFTLAQETIDDLHIPLPSIDGSRESDSEGPFWENIKDFLRYIDRQVKVINELHDRVHEVYEPAIRYEREDEAVANGQIATGLHTGSYRGLVQMMESSESQETKVKDLLERTGKADFILDTLPKIAAQIQPMLVIVSRDFITEGKRKEDLYTELSRKGYNAQQIEANPEYVYMSGKANDAQARYTQRENEIFQTILGPLISDQTILPAVAENIITIKSIVKNTGSRPTEMTYEWLELELDRFREMIAKRLGTKPTSQDATSNKTLTSGSAAPLEGQVATDNTFDNPVVMRVDEMGKLFAGIGTIVQRRRLIIAANIHPQVAAIEAEGRAVKRDEEIRYFQARQEADQHALQLNAAVSARIKALQDEQADSRAKLLAAKDALEAGKNEILSFIGAASQAEAMAIGGLLTTINVSDDAFRNFSVGVGEVVKLTRAELLERINTHRCTGRSEVAEVLRRMKVIARQYRNVEPISSKGPSASLVYGQLLQRQAERLSLDDPPSNSSQEEPQTIMDVLRTAGQGIRKILSSKKQ